MRTFAAAWPNREIVQAVLAQIPWYHQIALLDKLDRDDLRLWYAQKAVETRMVTKRSCSPDREPSS